MTDLTKNVWFAVFLTEFVTTFVINAFTLVAFARSRRRLKRSTYLIISLTVADLGIGAVAGPVDLWLFKTGAGKEPGHGYNASMISSIFYAASLVNIALISLERLHATLFPIKHFLLGKRIYYKFIFFSWFAALILTLVHCFIYMNEAVAGRYTWIIYVFVALLVLATSYVIIISKVIRKTNSQRLRSVISAERKLSVTLFIVSAASTLTLLPWVITTCISIRSGHLWIQFSPHGKRSNVVLSLYYLNSILNPLIYAFRLPEFKRILKGLFCKNTSSTALVRPIELRAM